MSELFSSLGINGKLLLAQAVNFLIVLWLLNRFVFKPLLSFIDERKQTITQGIEDGEKAKKELNLIGVARESELSKAREQGAETISQAKERAQQQEQEIISTARETEEKILLKAKQEAEAEKQGAVRGATDDISKIAVLLSEKILSRELTDVDEKKMRDDVVSQLDKEYGSR